MNISIALLIALGSLALPGVHTQDTVTTFAFTRMDVMVAMRDGTQLFTVVMRPTAMSGPLPFLMMRTPYGAESRADALATGPITVRSQSTDLHGEYANGAKNAAYSSRQGGTPRLP
jgi:predicted acyl esterase